MEEQTFICVENNIWKTFTMCLEVNFIGRWCAQSCRKEKKKERKKWGRGGKLGGNKMKIRLIYFSFTVLRGSKIVLTPNRTWLYT